jgi:hypothetical protein
MSKAKKKKHREGIFTTMVTNGFARWCWMPLATRINPPSSPSLTARGSLMGSQRSSR